METTPPPSDDQKKQELATAHGAPTSLENQVMRRQTDSSPSRTPCRRHLLASSRRSPPGPIGLHHHAGDAASNLLQVDTAVRSSSLRQIRSLHGSCHQIGRQRGACIEETGKSTTR
ncbi:Os03g0425150 [Oryza sativa Japonica Group]|uniref:Os03g0425150 protein n=2 Tax=Oryza TaxID=4527 RepID=A0A0P0VZM7_ORYSJ|nr:Os03g0425150 [Oryza sativa Japonica Group]